MSYGRGLLERTNTVAAALTALDDGFPTHQSRAKKMTSSAIVMPAKQTNTTGDRGTLTEHGGQCCHTGGDQGFAAGTACGADRVPHQSVSCFPPQLVSCCCCAPAPPTRRCTRAAVKYQFCASEGEFWGWIHALGMHVPIEMTSHSVTVLYSIGFCILPSLCCARETSTLGRDQVSV